MDWRALHRHGGDRGAEFYLSALTYAQHLWQRGLAARALLAVDRALLAEVPAGDPVFLPWPPPYHALRWIMIQASPESLVGNPRVHYQHLAGRLRSPRAGQQRARCWAAWHVARLVNPLWSSDPKHEVHEPTVEEISAALHQYGLPDEAAIWHAAMGHS
jgi:hypothetical protein